MLHYAYLAVLIPALWFNRQDWRALALTAYVGASAFSPTPRSSAEAFYLFCVNGELIAIALAIALRPPARSPVCVICSLLVLSHVLGYEFDGSLPLSPYRAVVKILEFMEIAVCLICAPTAALFLRNRGWR